MRFISHLLLFLIVRLKDVLDLDLPKLRVFDFPVREDSSYSIYYNNLQQEVELELIQRYYHNSINVIKIDNEWSVC